MCWGERYSFFFQLKNDDAALKINYEYQSFVMQFSDRIFWRNDVEALFLSNFSSIKAIFFDELVKNAFAEVEGKHFIEALTLLVQDQVEKKVV